MSSLIKPIYPVAVILLLTGCNRQEKTQPQIKDITDAVFASGYIITDDEYTVTANADGYLSDVFVKEGDTVARGSRLFYLSHDGEASQLENALANYQDAQAKLQPSSPQLMQQTLQVEQARAQLATDEANFRRYSELVKTQAVSQADYEKVKLAYESSRHNLSIQEQALNDLHTSLQLNFQNAKTQLAVQQEANGDYMLTAAIQGIVLHVYKKPGDLVRRGEVIGTVGGGEYLAKLMVAEEDINLVRTGQKTLISLNTDKDHPLPGTVSKVYPAFDENEQSFIVESRLNEKPEVLFANTQLQANIIIASKKDALIIPAGYLLEGDSVMLSDKTIQKVQVGIRNQQWVEITGGITPDNTILLPKIKSR